MDSDTITKAYLKMKNLCINLSNEIQADIKIQNQHVFPRYQIHYIVIEHVSLYKVVSLTFFFSFQFNRIIQHHCSSVQHGIVQEA